MDRRAPEKKISGDDLLDALLRACDGLVFISETDAEIIPYSSPASKAAITPEAAAEAAGVEIREPVEATTAKSFFAKLTRKCEWHTEAQRLNAERSHELEKLLNENLEGLRVYRFGRIQIAIVAAGRDAGGRIAGIKTSAVET